MRITALEPQGRNPERVDVHVDGVFRMSLSAELAYGAALRTDDLVTPERLEQLEAQDQAWRAREAALNLLSYRPRTESEMRRRLREKGFAPGVIADCLAELVERGLLNDATFAESFVRDRLRFRPRGTELLVQELRTKGVDWETARATVNEVLQEEEVSETELARQAAAKWAPRGGEIRLRARRRLYNFLARRGFGPEAVREVVDELLP
jgi:regulatory protein